MPEMQFVARWPDGEVHSYYSPSTVVVGYLEAGASYGIAEFVERSRAALFIASERVRVKYGFACSRAARSLEGIEEKAREFADYPNATVRIEAHAGIV